MVKRQTTDKQNSFPRITFLNTGRVVLGAIFIYAGFFKITNFNEFRLAVEGYNYLLPFLRTLIIYTVPWIELILGLLLITGLKARYVAAASSGLLLVFIFFTVLNTFKGTSTHCGCFPESFFLNSKEPVFLLVRNNILLFISIGLITTKKGMKTKPIIGLNKHAFEFWTLFMILFSISILMILVAEKRNEKRYVEAAIGERQSLLEIANISVGTKLPKSILKGEDGSLISTEQLKGNFLLFLLLSTLDCRPCIDEAYYFQNLYERFADKMYIFGVVGPLGHTAVGGFKESYSLSYPILQDLRTELRTKLGTSVKAIKILVSPSGEILNVDPPTYNVLSLQKEYEESLIRYLGKGG